MAKVYPKYKDSGTPWIGKVPDDWDVLPNRTLFYEIKERGHIDEQLISVTISQGIIRQTDLISNSSKKDSSNEDKSKYKLVVPGDIAYNKMRAWQGAVGVSQYRGIVSPAYIVVRPRRKQNAKYFHYLLRTPAFAREAERWSYGITSDQWSLRAEHFKMIYCPVPSTEEQKAIVEYLDVVNKMIRRYIREKQKVIKLLNEQRQSIINRAVTRGIDSNAKFKSSEIDWIGDVPDHWVVKPLKFWVKINQDVLSEDTDENFEFHYLDIGSVGTGILDRTPEKLIFGNAPSRARRILKEGDTIISTVRTYLKAVYFISQKTENLIASTGFAVLTPCANVYPEFLSLVIQSNSFVEQVTANSIGVTYPAIAETKLGALNIAMPPDMSEQVRIVEDIKSKTMTYDEMIAGLRNEIAFIDEYRTRLISDAVTGKIDVRDIKLPEIKDMTDSEPIEDQETLEDVEDTEEVVNADE
ncbi:MAG: restriction endonuclease subunit S [Candidatus Omnitrophica bacterium]|nr:restriction endonuclease subunit S [Candidatus Omnitrophota bacterium]MCG2703429.1 restriction endonuclease subunit S [Candidatus Omnitrophota bacterium]